MSSYYNRIIGTLSPSEIARSEDIHLIQSNIQTAFQEMITDLFGLGCILGEEEENLKLIPTPYTIDQSNTNYNDDNPWISFSDVYFRQQIDITKTEIQAIRVTIRNNTNLMPTVFAEIRDSNFNLIKETNVKLEDQTFDGAEVDFIFNLEHLPLDSYYFVIRPVDINTADLTANGDETQYDTITEESFEILCDRSGNYNQSLCASYNGVDYLEARLLEGELKSAIADGFIETEDENFDLCFEHIFSSGNTYLINNIAPCIVLGEKIYPIDTHVSLDGPSPSGNRIDLVSLTTDGQLNVTKGIPFVGEKTDENYPINNTGLKIAYITTYFGSDTEWMCNSCGEGPYDSNVTICPNCGATTTIKTPIIEQDDDNGITRRRDILERLRRLEKKMDYQTEYNSPSRIKYNCTVNPTLDVTNIAEASYNVTATKNDNGENIVLATSDLKTKDYTWSIADATYTYSTGSSTKVTVSCKDVHIPKDKPKKVDKTKKYIKVQAKDKSSKVPIVISLTLKIQNQKTKKNLHSEKINMNSEGTVYIDPWKYKLKKGKYNIVISYGSKKITNLLQVYETNKFNATPKTKSMTFSILDGTLKEKKVDLDASTFTGDDSFYKDNITVDTDAGEVYLKKIKTSADATVTKFPTQSLTDLDRSNYTYKIISNKKSLQSEYPMLNITLSRDCKLNSVTFKIAGTSNIKYMRAILFKNDRVFNLNTSRKSYRKYLKTADAKDTAFPNIKVSDQINVGKNGKSFEYTMPVNKKIEKGTYSLLLYGILNDKTKDGYIKIKEYHTAKATAYGALSRVKGTSSPNQIFMEGENLTNRTMYVKFNKIDDEHNVTGTIISKTINTVDNIISCKLSHFYDIPNGCYIHTYVSNNGGKTYVEQTNNSGQVVFNGAGHELKWRLVFTGNGATSPKLLFKKNKKYAFKISVKTGQKLSNVEDYDRCFSTPVLNANAITRQLVSNQDVETSFSEWEYCRLWMEDEDLAPADIDICFAYAYDDYTTSVLTPLSSIQGKNIFFSQIFSSLLPSDFSHTSVDYDNYNADVEEDELNFRFNLETDYMYNYTVGQLAANPMSTTDEYTYGDITNESTDMSMFTYGLMDIDTIYTDDDDKNDGVSILYAPYYQVQYHASTEPTVIETDEPEDSPGEDLPPEENITEDNTTIIAWAADSDPNFNKDACLIGVSFANGVTIEEKYTAMKVAIFPNLRDCAEKDENGTLLFTSITEDDDNDPSTEEITYNNILERNGIHINSKYYTDDDKAYIPGGTLELVVAFNPWGLVEENNAAYGKVFTITQDLISCVYQEISIDLSDLYGSTIYSIGLRVSENAEYQTIDGVQKHPSLQDGDILGIGNVTFTGYNIRPYTPYVQNDTSAKRWRWQKDENASLSSVYVQNKLDGKDNYVQTLITGTQQNATFYEKKGTWLKQISSTELDTSTIQKANGKITNTIKTKLNGKTYTNKKSDSNEIVFDIQDTSGYLFKLETDLNLTVYDYINVRYFVEQDPGANLTDANGDNGEINKGDITLLLYDTTDVVGAEPIERLRLPAWGRIQESVTYANQPDKRVNAWFKVRSDARQVKCIRLHRNNPTGRNTGNIKLHITDILFYNAAEMPALGPQMQVRIYPKNMSGLYNTKIRKFGGIYRLR